MIFDKYVSENELEEIRNKYGKKIIMFPRVQEEMSGYYEKFGLPYPNLCINNFRDSWFHYRKIWEEHSYFSIISQMSTLDEHLQRAERDAVVNLLQMLSQKMEFWYLLGKRNDMDQLKNDLGEDDISLGTMIKFEDTDSFFQYWHFFGGDEKKATSALVYAVSVAFLTQKECYKEIQDILHCIKNSALKIRFGASEIDRLNEPGEYLECCRIVLDKIFNSKYYGTYLFWVQIYDVVMANLEYFHPEMLKEVNMRENKEAETKERNL